MKAGFSLWINNEEDKKVFGLGPYNLLLLIDELGSLNKAAKKMEISYSKALSVLKKAEEELGVVLLHKEIGGSKGGGSTLTLEARDIVKKYGKYKEEASLAIDKIFKEIWEE